MARDKKVVEMPQAPKEILTLTDKEKNVIRGIVGQFDTHIQQLQQQMESVQSQKTAQLQIMAQLSASSSDKDFHFAQYLIDDKDIVLEITQ